MTFDRNIRDYFGCCSFTGLVRAQVSDPHAAASERMSYSPLNSSDLLENRLSPILEDLADIAEVKFLDAPIEASLQRAMSMSCCSLLPFCRCLLKSDRPFRCEDGGKLAACRNTKDGNVYWLQFPALGSCVGLLMS